MSEKKITYYVAETTVGEGTQFERCSWQSLYYDTERGAWDAVVAKYGGDPGFRRDALEDAQLPSELRIEGRVIKVCAVEATWVRP